MAWNSVHKMLRIKTKKNKKNTKNDAGTIISHFSLKYWKWKCYQAFKGAENKTSRSLR